MRLYLNTMFSCEVQKLNLAKARKVLLSRIGSSYSKTSPFSDLYKHFSTANERP